MDVDGVLTDGHVWLLSRRDGTASEIKGFSAYDGAGLKLARAAGLRTGLITGRESRRYRSARANAKSNSCIRGARRKLAHTRKFCDTTGAAETEVAYVGDDLPDFRFCSASDWRLPWPMPRRK